MSVKPVTPVTLRLEAYSRSGRRLVAAAQELADGRRHSEVEPIHLLYMLADQDETVRAAIAACDSDPDDVLVEGELCLRRLGHAQGPAYLSPRMLDLLNRAEGEAARQGGMPIGPSHLLLAVAQTPAGDAKLVLASCGLSAPVLREHVSSGQRSPGGTESMGYSGDAYGVDLTQRARQGAFEPTVGRDAELRRVVRVLARHGSRNPLLVGEAGVGKHSIVEALADRIAHGDVPTMLQDKHLVEVTVSKLLAGARARGEAEERLQRWLAGVRDSAGEVIVYVRDLATLLGSRGDSTAAQVLSDALREGWLQMLATADPTTYKGLPRVADLERYFVRIDVEQPDGASTIAMLRARVRSLEIAHGLQIADPALTAAARLARRYLREAQLPKGALDLVDAAAARLRVEMQSVPTSIDERRHRLAAIAIEVGSLADDGDAASHSNRRELEREQATLSQELSELEKRWQRELASIAQINDAKAEVAAVERELSALEPDDERAKNLRKTTLPALVQQRGDAESCLSENGRLVRETVDATDVAAVVADWTGVPVARMMEAEADKLMHMEARIGQRVIGQARAVGAVSRAVRRSRAGLRDAKRPIGSFLFLGTSGVGKTELAKGLAEFLFDDEAALTRLDMSEFMEKHTVARLLGAPPGYAGSEEGGFLTEAVRRRPYSVLLFDEVEKAHPDVFNILLQVLDDGRLTDSRGRVAHFADCVILLTSNLGAQSILEHATSNPQAALQASDDTQRHSALPQPIQQALSEHFRPEFLNRIDELVIFETLTREHLIGILELQLRRLNGWLAPRGLSLELTAAAKRHLVELGYDPAFGARPLTRVLQRKLQDPLSERLLSNAYAEGDKVHVDVKDGSLVLSRPPASRERIG